MIKLEMACVTDIGLKRSVNQDCVAFRSALNVAILADGMGGYKAGEVASRKAIDVVCDLLEQGVCLHDAIDRANTEVYALSLQYEAYQGMGTTLLATQFSQDKLTIANVGDSRLYRLREHRFKQLTVDQTLAQQMLEQDIEYHDGKHVSAYAHILTNALGVGEEMGISMQEELLIKGDIYLLCSDGLSGVLSDDKIATILGDQSSTLDGILQSLLEAALSTTASDNISMAAVRCY